jgi:hypothetical protein
MLHVVVDPESARAAQTRVLASLDEQLAGGTR